MEVSIKPGCFGSPLCYSTVTPVCGKCNFALACAPASVIRSSKLMDKYSIKALIARKHEPKKIKVVEIEQPKKKEKKPNIVFLKTPAKEVLLEKVVTRAFSELASAGVNLKDVVSSRVNTIPNNMFIYHAVNSLLEGAVSANSLMNDFKIRVGMSSKYSETCANASIRMLIRSGGGVRDHNSWMIVPHNTIEVENLN